MPRQKSCFVTVGTTQFEALIKEMSKHETLKTLGELGYTDITMQVGNGEYKPEDIVNTDCSSISPRLPNVSHFGLAASLEDYYANADLVISHAGAGTVLGCLGKGKRLLVVINDDLMGNHQAELADKLTDESHCHSCHVSNLLSTLKTLSWDSIIPFPPGQPEKLSDHLNMKFGFKT